MGFGSADSKALERIANASEGTVEPVTATTSNVNVAAADTLILAANTARKSGSTIVCDTTAISYIKLGSGSSSSSYTGAVDGKTTVPGVFNIPDGYLGAVYGTGSAANGAWRVTEMT